MVSYSVGFFMIHEIIRMSITNFISLSLASSGTANTLYKVNLCGYENKVENLLSQVSRFFSDER